MELDVKHYMREAIAFSQERNPVWPFATVVVNGKGDIICKATDCAHISPLYHSESLAIHALIQQVDVRKLGDLTLVTTVEPDPLSQSAIYWAKITQELSITHLAYGSSLSTINKLWPFCIDISAGEIVDRAPNYELTIEGSILEAQTDDLLLTAKHKQEQIDKKHPGACTLSKDVTDYFEISLPSD